MLSIRRCRELLGSACLADDSQLEQLRDQAYAIAGVVVDQYLEHSNKEAATAPRIPKTSGTDATGFASKSAGFDKALAMIPDLEQSEVIERAAIMEFEAGLPRAVAEKSAVWDWGDRKRGAVN